MTWEELLLRPGLIGADIDIWRDNGPERIVLRGKVKNVQLSKDGQRVTFWLYHGRAERPTLAAKPHPRKSADFRGVFLEKYPAKRLWALRGSKSVCVLPYCQRCGDTAGRRFDFLAARNLIVN